MVTVRDVMTPAPHTIGATQTIAEAARRMRELHVRHLPVLDGGQLVGLLSDRDVRLVETLAERDDVRVDEVMSAEPFAVEASTPLTEVVSTMVRRKLGSAVVRERSEIVGIFTTTDALALLERHLGAHTPAAF
jgi:acetoin utilization protein AcuB